MDQDGVEAIIRSAAERPDLVDQFVGQYRSVAPAPANDLADEIFAGVFLVGLVGFGLAALGGAFLNYPWHHQAPIVLAGYVLLVALLVACLSAFVAFMAVAIETTGSNRP